MKRFIAANSVPSPSGRPGTSGVVAKSRPRLVVPALIVAALLWPVQPASAQAFIPWLSKLVGPVGVSAGFSAALSGDGSTALIGGFGVDFVFRRRGSPLWTLQQQGGGGSIGASVALPADGSTYLIGDPSGDTGQAWVGPTGEGIIGRCNSAILVGTSAIGNAKQGQSVALSGDGNTAVVGGYMDNEGVGATWVFVCTGGVWTQQAKLVGSDVSLGVAAQGYSVAVSGDGNTVLVGGYADNNNIGAAWVFTRISGVWTQQGQKLVGTSANGSAQQGTSVALSADGNTALMGGHNDSNSVGAAWVFTRSGGAWSQQGVKLIGTASVGSSNQGWSVALSGDGNTALLGGPSDNNFIGAAWAFIRSGTTWSQLGNKIIGGQAVGAANQGYSVALSADGNVALVGGPGDNSSMGAGWVFIRNSVKWNATDTHDFNGDTLGDIAWRDAVGNTSIWFMVGNSVAFSAAFGRVPTNWQLVGQRDFNNDFFFDLLWRDSNTGALAIWFMDGSAVQQSGPVGTVPLNWSVVGTSDLNHDGRGDILWRDTNTGALAVWLMNGLSVQQSVSLGVVPPNWTIVATTGRGNIFWRDTNTGALAISEVYGFEVVQSIGVGVVPLNWLILGIGDFDGNGSSDILWRDANTGAVSVWLMNGPTVMLTGSLGVVPSNWIVATTGDFNGDNISDILWRDASGGTVAIWFMNGLQVSSSKAVAAVGLDWTIQGLNAD
jgi:hypothetical protein